MDKVKKDGPLVSVIIPTYNQAYFLREAIRSVLSQSYENLELIIIDNHSNDNTQEVVDSFSDNRIRYFKFKNNGIIAASRNFGMEKINGEYIAFLDSDDIWFKDKIKKQVEIFESNPDVWLTFCPFRVDSPMGNMKGRIIGPHGSKVCGHMYEKLLFYNFIISSSAMMRSAVKSEFGGFDESPSMRYIEDFDLWLRIARNYKMASIPEVMGIYRLHGSNMSADGKRLERALSVIDEHHRKGWIPDSTLRKARTLLYLREGWDLTGGEKALAKSFFLKALQERNCGTTIHILGYAGIALCLFPGLCRFLKKNCIDKKIISIISNLKEEK